MESRVMVNIYIEHVQGRLSGQDDVIQPLEKAMLVKGNNGYYMKYMLALIAILLPMMGMAGNKVIYIYQDADLSNSSESSTAIQEGIELAFDEIGNEIDGYKVEFKYLDHRSNVVRSKRNFQSFIDDPNALAIFSGKQSPPLIRNRAFINDQRALTLVPWAAGGPVTRHPSSENWIFRLSVDDTQAGPVIIDFAVKEKECRSPHLLLERTPWGESNLKSMPKALHQNGISDVQATRFSLTMKGQRARAILRDIKQIDADCIVLVANSKEGAVIVREMLKYPENERLPIISHWGITGDNFPSAITAKDREGLDLYFIQTCFSFTNAEQSELAKRVFSRLKRYKNGAIEHPKEIKAAVGFIHAYDLTRILVHAIEQAGLTGDIVRDRNAVRLALEDVKEPVKGLVKTYDAPFSQFDEDTNPNAHEALSADSYCMGRYGPANEILLVQH